MSDSDQTLALLERAKQGDAEALDSLFTRHRSRLTRLIQFRLRGPLQARVDTSDVLQEMHVDAWGRLDRYLEDPDRMPFFLWLRFLAEQKFVQLHRHHVGAQRRDVRREVHCHGFQSIDPPTLAAELMGSVTSPLSRAERAERHETLIAALDEMDPIDRDVLTLRHFEHLTTEEAAEVLGIGQPAASKRYIRALRRLKTILGPME
jgi:RNA polymerase sigma-70 factor (ECF subfamily)